MLFHIFSLLLQILLIPLSLIPSQIYGLFFFTYYFILYTHTYKYV